jgi:radical SAM superfamily enzyme YgiQ (UPF0313 family)
MLDLLEEQILPKVQKPARYTGGELNQIVKDWDKTDVKVCLSYPDTYEVGMSNLGLQILHHIINSLDFALAERAYTPWPDMEGELRRNKLRLYSLESFKPLSDFDLIGFSLQHELTYTNLLNMLDLSGIPIRAADRYTKSRSPITDHRLPLIFAGGPSSFNPEPVADFIDFFLIGEGEEAIVEILETFKTNKQRPREEILSELAKLEGIYVPRLKPSKVKRRIVKDLDKAPYPVKPLVPFIEVIHDRAMLEIMRGCPRSCKFCQARACTHPVRTRKVETLVKQAEEIIKNTGYEELSLVSLSTSDHPKIEELAKTLAAKFENKKVSIALPSVRMDSFSIKLAKEISKVRPATVTLAPEAGTERLRKHIGKDLSEDEILSGAAAAFESGIEKIKLYFMIGLPTEKEEDIEGIITLSKKIAQVGRDTFFASGRNKKRLHITASVSTFIPKPHTPFEREAQISIAETLSKQRFIKNNLRDKVLEVRWHDSGASFLEGVFARGDRELAKVIQAAWKQGCRLDAWSEHFKLELWDKAFKEAGVDPNVYLAKRDEKEELPWGFIEV